MSYIKWPSHWQDVSNVMSECCLHLGVYVDVTITD